MTKTFPFPAFLKITLSDDDQKTLAVVDNWAAANTAAKAIFKRQMACNLYYDIEHPKVSVTGCIDLEPASFHQPHADELFTWHLATFWGNVAKAQPGQYMLTEEDIALGKKVLSALPPVSCSMSELFVPSSDGKSISHKWTIYHSFIYKTSPI